MVLLRMYHFSEPVSTLHSTRHSARRRASPYATARFSRLVHKRTTAFDVDILHIEPISQSVSTTVYALHTLSNSNHYAHGQNTTNS